MARAAVGAAAEGAAVETAAVVRVNYLKIHTQCFLMMIPESAPMAAFGLLRSSRHQFTLPPSEDGTLDALPLDILWAPPPGRALSDSAQTPAPDLATPIIVYVLDPEPVLFGAAALFAYSSMGYFASAGSSVPETSYRRLHVIGIGHRTSDFLADGQARALKSCGSWSP